MVIDTTGQARRVFASDNHGNVESASPDMQYIAYSRVESVLGGSPNSIFWIGDLTTGQRVRVGDLTTKGGSMHWMSNSKCVLLQELFSDPANLWELPKLTIYNPVTQTSYSLGFNAWFVGFFPPPYDYIGLFMDFSQKTYLKNFNVNGSPVCQPWSGDPAEVTLALRQNTTIGGGLSGAKPILALDDSGSGIRFYDFTGNFTNPTYGGMLGAPQIDVNASRGILWSPNGQYVALIYPWDKVDVRSYVPQMFSSVVKNPIPNTEENPQNSWMDVHWANDSQHLYITVRTSRPLKTYVYYLSPEFGYSTLLYESPIPTDHIGMYDPETGTFHLKNTHTGSSADLSFAFGGTGDVLYPVAGDWDGDGVDTIGVYNSTEGRFLLRNSNSAGSADINQLYGNPGDKPVTGRWKYGSLTDGIGVFRSSSGMVFYLSNSPTSGVTNYAVVLGSPGDVGIAGDWNADGQDSLGVFRPSNTRFYLSDYVQDGVVYSDYDFVFGNATDLPVAGDWTGSGFTGVGMFRPSTSQFFLKNALAAGDPDTTFTFGDDGFLPIAGHWTIPAEPPALVDTESPPPLSAVLAPVSNPGKSNVPSGSGD